MKVVTALAIIGMGIGTAVAGPMGSPAPAAKGKTIEIVEMEPIGCACFEPCKLEVSAFYTHAWSDHGALDGEDGGGISFGYFYNKFLGTRLSYAAIGSKPYHDTSASLVARYPIESICLAPYALVGGGVLTNGSTGGTAHIGGGIEYKIEAANCLGVFVEGRYTWHDETDGYSNLSTGLRFSF